MLHKLEFLAVQSADYRDRFLALGADPAKLHLTGSIKFDGVRTDRNQPLTCELREFFRIQSAETVFIAGSTQDPEELLATQVYLKLRQRFPQLRLIVVPRHPERAADIVRQFITLGVGVHRRSTGEVVSSPTQQGPPVGLLDTVGELGACWGLAHIAFVGGSFGNRGGQNMLEPAAYGAAVCFGPNTRNFRQIVELLVQDQAVQVVQDAQELEQFIERLLRHPEQAVALGAKAQQLVLTQQGATDRSVELILDALASVAESS
jgi:3-deoxy-D-manno-octulosonic-acid transferase